MKIDSRRMNFRDRNLVFIDIETTGLAVDRHEIIEIGSLVVSSKKLEILSEYEAKIKPLNIETADSIALEINGYSKEKWTKAIPLKRALVKLNEISEEGMLAGWNVFFDWIFLNNAFEKFNIKPLFDYHLIDVASVAYTKFMMKNKPENLSLRNVAPLFDIKLGKIHGALEDARVTYEIYKQLLA